MLSCNHFTSGACAACPAHPIVVSVCLHLSQSGEDWERVNRGSWQVRLFRVSYLFAPCTAKRSQAMSVLSRVEPQLSLHEHSTSQKHRNAIMPSLETDCSNVQSCFVSGYGQYSHESFSGYYWLRLNADIVAHFRLQVCSELPNLVMSNNEESTLQSGKREHAQLVPQAYMEGECSGWHPYLRTIASLKAPLWTAFFKSQQGKPNSGTFLLCQVHSMLERTKDCGSQQ